MTLYQGLGFLSLLFLVLFPFSVTLFRAISIIDFIAAYTIFYLIFINKFFHTVRLKAQGPLRFIQMSLCRVGLENSINCVMGSHKKVFFFSGLTTKTFFLFLIVNNDFLLQRFYDPGKLCCRLAKS